MNHRFFPPRTIEGGAQRRRPGHSMARGLACCLLLAGIAARAAPPEADPATPPAAQGAATVHEWHAAARDAIARQRPNQQAALRLLAYLAWAQHLAAESMPVQAASETAWQALFDKVSEQTLSALLPAETTAFQQLASRRNATPTAELAHARMLAEQAAHEVNARAANDGFAAEWTGSLPVATSAWRSQLQPPRAPHLPGLASMKPVFLASVQAVLPPAPPAVDSAAFRQALAEVKSRSQGADPQAAERAKRWEMVTGSLVAGFWDETAARLAMQHRLTGRELGRVMAATLGATLDANIACHAAKYTHWTPRPSQVDPSIRPLVGLPNHPSYPSNHACDSGAAAEVLAAFFPAERDALRAMARDASESRIDGGIHYRFDIEGGLAIGRAAAQAALKAMLPSAMAAVARP